MIVLEFIKQFYTIIFIWLSAATAILALRKKLQFSYRMFAWLIIFLSVMWTIAYILAFNKITNHFLFNIFDPVEFFILPLFYYYQLNNFFLKKIIRIYLWVFPAFVIINAALIQDFFILTTNSYVFGGTFILILSVTYLWQLYISDETKSIFLDPVFWISLAYLFYCAIAVLFLGMLNELWKKDPGFTRKYYFIIYHGAIILNRVLLTVAFLCMKPIMKQN